MTAHLLCQWVISLPLIGFLLAGVGGHYMDKRFIQWMTCSLMSVATIAGAILFFKVTFYQEGGVFNILPWIHIGVFKIDWGLKIDSLSATMTLVVTAVSFLVHIYSLGYMAQDESISRFMAYLGFFTFAMLMLVMAPNFIQLFFGWEGVGLASYLLIGFWYKKPRACDASFKAFIINRVGDVGLILAMATLFAFFHTLEIDAFLDALQSPSFYQNRPSFLFFGCDVDVLTLMGVLFAIGAMGKSAQIGLHTWLPDAMEGPTPVSALIHAATMVTAGVFLLTRLSFLYELTPLARDFILIAGMGTSLFAAAIALTQTDIKRVIAYSTCSQLGYMFIAIGCSGYGAAMFHLVTHAFFKALLFLGAGSVIHAMSDEQEMNQMGGLYKMIPQTYLYMWIGSLSLSGIPYLSGYYSKESILETAFLSGTLLSGIAFWVGIFVAFLTAFYSWRLLILTFHGSPKANDKVMAHVHESPFSMIFPLMVLSGGAILGGYLLNDYFIGSLAASFWGKSLVVLNSHKTIPFYIKTAPLIAAGGGILIAYLIYGQKEGGRRIPSLFNPLFLFLKNKGYIDEIYAFLFVRIPLLSGEILWRIGDKSLIDRLGPEGAFRSSQFLSHLVSRMQTGYVSHYAFAIIVGILFMGLGGIWIQLRAGYAG